ncbi:MAG: nitronate monooxygenase [Myxococcota bacterium]
MDAPGDDEVLSNMMMEDNAAQERKEGHSGGGGVLYTRICELFGVRYPIVQTGMGWVSGPELTAATSAAGGLGILAAATMTYDELKAAIAEVQRRTDKPFGVNMRADQQGAQRVVQLIIDTGVKLASFAGPPRREQIDAFKAAGVLTMPTIGARKHAVKMQSWGVDAVIAQGHEGGGHTGPIPTSLLLPSVCSAVDIPVLGAGGFSSGRGLVAALAYGADGIAMGTRFLLTRDSTVPDKVKQTYLKTRSHQTVVTTSIDGWPQRVIRTPLIDRLETAAGEVAKFPIAAYNALRFRNLTGTPLVDMLKEGLAMKQSQGLTWSQLALAANAPMLTKASMVDGRIEVGILPTGQVVGEIEELPSCEELLQRIMAEAEATLARLHPPSSAPAALVHSGADGDAEPQPSASAEVEMGGEKG